MESRASYGTFGRTWTVALIVARPRCQRCHRPPIDVRLISTIDRGGAAAAIRLPFG